MFSTTIDVMPLVLMIITSLVIPLVLFLLKLAVGRVTKLLTPYLGAQEALALQQHANELLDKGIGEAALHFLPELQARGLTVDLGSMIAARVAGYAVSHAPDLAGKISSFEGSLEEKVKGRLITHPAIHTAVASGRPQDIRPAAQAA